jgi:hypothetical protein
LATGALGVAISGAGGFFHALRIIAIADLTSSALANEHFSFFTDKPSEAKGVFIQRLYRSLGLAAHLG